MKRIEKRKSAKNILIMAIILSICTGIDILFKYIGFSELNTIMAYLLGILFYSYLAGSYFYSFVASVFGVFLYNFFFIHPYTLGIFDLDYMLTLTTMFVIGFFTSALTIRIRQKTFLAEEREKRISTLYQAGRELFSVKNRVDPAETTAKIITNQLAADILVVFYDDNGQALHRYVKGNDVFNDNDELNICREAYLSGSPCGHSTKLFSEGKVYYLPLIGTGGVIGMIGVSPHKSQPLRSEQKEFLGAIARQITLVLERERFYEKHTQMQARCENLRADMLRTISHDFRTPLAGIIGSVSTMIDNYGTLSDEVMKKFLVNIYDESSWLNDQMENMPSATRLDGGSIMLNIAKEAAEEIVAEAIEHIKKRSTEHKIVANMPAELVLLEVDGILIKQVLINLLDNAVKYTPGGSEITVSVTRTEKNVNFEVSDNGPGILETDISRIFERFYKIQPDKAFNSRQGPGMGLSLCKSIVEAHDGQISISRNSPHGTVVKFSIPLKEENVCAADYTDN